jgi:hypothetical protein
MKRALLIQIMYPDFITELKLRVYFSYDFTATYELYLIPLSI